MSRLKICDAIIVNPSERNVDVVDKKIPMESLIIGQKKVSGYIDEKYNGATKFRNGDTLLAKITPCLENGKTAYVDILKDQEVGFGSTEFIVLRENPGVTIKEFIYYLASSPTFRNIAIASMTGTSGRKRVDEFIFKNKEIDIPTLEEQKRISGFLSSIDNKIENNNKINDNLYGQLSTLYDYWFTQFDFPNEEGKPYRSSGGQMVYNEQLKREIPLGWTISKLKEVTDICLGGTPKTSESEYWNGDINWLNSGEIAQFPIVDSKLKISKLGLDSSAAKLMTKGSVVVSITGNIRASILSIDSTANQSVIGISEKGTFKKTYLYSFISNKLKYLTSICTGNCQKHINKQTVEDIKILIPSESILELFNEQSELLFEQISNNSIENKQLVSLRDWLLPMLMNGQATISE